VAYVLHSTETRLGHRPRYAVRETREDLLVWAHGDAPLATAAAVVRFLTDCAGDLSAHEVRATLAPLSDLDALATPPSAVRPDRV
jgi:hypothetical protein